VHTLIQLPGRPELLFVAPHAPAPLEAALPFVVESAHAELAERVADWHDLGSDVALEAATARSGCAGGRPTLPRAVMDLNRGWRGRTEERETLFGKGALDAWVTANLREGALAQLEAWYRQAQAQIREGAQKARGLVELHSYGDLGSTYDRLAGGRPVRRAEAAAVHGAPWVTAFPVGLARLIPANLTGTPWALEARVGAALADHHIRLGQSPYPALLPWTVSARFLAERWFRWLGRTSRLPLAVAEQLGEIVWLDEQHAGVEAAATGEAPPGEWPGVADLARLIGAWTHEGSQLADQFLAEDGSFTLGMELRIDLRDRAASFGEAIAEAVA
jgi:hypothetical protein